MPSRPTTSQVARWITPDPEAVSHIVTAVLREEAWWTALRCGKYAQTTVIWADGACGEETPLVLTGIVAEAADTTADLNLKT